MNTTATTRTTSITAKVTALADALADLSFKDGDATVALSVPQATTLATIALTGKAKATQKASAGALYRLALIDQDVTKPNVHTLTTKGTALIKKASRAAKAAPAVVVEVTPAAKPAVKKATKDAQAKHFDHSTCDHPRTPAARAACRKAHAKA